MARERIALRFVIAGREHDYATLTRPLLHSLERSHHFSIETGREAAPRGAAVVIAASDEPLDAAGAAELNDFVRSGGGLILLHGTLAAWSEHAAIAELAGWTPGGRG